MKATKFFFVFMILSFGLLHSQTQICGNSNDPNPVIPSVLYKSSLTWNIPVIFHVIISSSNSGDVLDSQLTAQINELNSEFLETRFSFYLAGIRRTINDNWRNLTYSDPPSQQEIDMKNALSIDPVHSLNIYITSINGSIKGWAKYPWDYYANQNPSLFGVVIRPNVLPGGDDPDNNMGRVTTHEVGHYLGLYHTFDPDCKDADGVSDTPIHQVNYGCPSPNPDTCPQPGLDPIHNQMNYTNDPCRYEITIGQIYRMNQIVQQYKPNLGGSIINISNDITINSGNSLQLLGNITVNFSSGKKINVSGTFNSNNVTYTSSNTWSGIQFNNGSSGNLQYCNISNAAVGIYFNNSSAPQIRYCTFEYNGTAISCDYYSSPQIISNSNFRYNTYDGLRCNSYSSPGLLSYGYPGYNVIRNNSRYGVYASYNSNPVLGRDNGVSTHGLNSIYSNSSCEVLAEYNCTIIAQNNWWGSANPSPYEFCTNSSTITYLPVLSSDPNPGRLVVPTPEEKIIPIKGISLSKQTDDLPSALDKQRDKKYDEAIPLFLEVFKSNKDALVGKYALIKIEECFTQAGKKDFLEYSKKELKPIIKTATETFVVLLELETHQLVNAGSYKEAMENLFLIKEKYNLNEEIGKNTLYRIGVFYSDLYGDKKNAQKYFDELKTKYPKDDLVNLIDRWLNTKDGELKSGSYIAVAQAAAETPAAENSGVAVENYPNPFNPSTRISFTIPQKSQIKLKVFDVLGREVANLADGVYEIGRYEVTFDASNLPSGVYFYNLTTGTSSITKKMLLIK